MEPRLSALDSNRFELNVARAEAVTSADVPALLAFCRLNDVDLVIVRVDGGDYTAARTLTASGLTMLETLIVYEGPLGDGPEPPAGIRLATAADTAAVERIAVDAFARYGGHYHADPRLPVHLSRQIYVDWVRRGITGESGDFVLVAETEGTAVGFCLIDLQGDTLYFQLSAMLASARGRGLSHGFVHFARTWGRDRGMLRFGGVAAHGTPVVHANLIAAGCLPVRTVSTFHGWRDQMGL